jgi:hypothetical protein
MKKATAVPCSTAVELFRGLYARVGRNLGLDASYISRIARGERKSSVAESVLNREFNRILASIKNASIPSEKNRGRRTRKKVQQKR